MVAQLGKYDETTEEEHNVWSCGAGLEDSARLICNITVLSDTSGSSRSVVL